MEKPTAIAVIARYKEKTAWHKKLHKLMPTIVYNKKDPEDPNYLPNIPRFDCPSFRGVWHAKTPTGREAHTYLYHIIKNYPNFPDLTFFSQGSLRDHSAIYAELLHFMKTTNLDKVDFFHFGPPELSLEDSRPLHIGLPIEKYYKDLFDAPCPPIFLFHLEACFFVSKRRILARPLEFYERMMQIIYEEPLSGYIFERFWDTIFNSSIPCKKSYPAVDRSTWQFEDL